MAESLTVIDPRREAAERLAAIGRGDLEARVLEPSPPAVREPPWFADDPVAVPAARSRPVVSPVPTGDLTWDDLARRDDELAAWCADRWLGAWRPLRPVADPARFATTRDSWHRLAEWVLAPARCRATGKIGLRFTRHGFGTPFYRTPTGDAQVRVEGHEVLVVGDRVRAVPATTLRDVGAVLELEPGTTSGLYEPASDGDPDRRLEIDADMAARLGDWIGFAASCLETLRAGASDADATRAQIWPEHFDASVDLGDEAAGRRGTFGASPGDDTHPLPYLYVTHWAEVGDDQFWNDDAFGGASLGYEAIVAAPSPREAALAFLRAGVTALQHA